MNRFWVLLIVVEHISASVAIVIHV